MADAAGQTAEQRRAKREARRAARRENNVCRAAKMHAARLELQAGRFSADHTDAVHEAKACKPGFNVGCSGWFYWGWRGKFYPEALPTKDWFGHYAGRFKTVELNAPFYSWPTIATVKSWVRQAGRRRFLYTVKVCELITHVMRFEGTQELVRDFGMIADLLGSQMGCFLFQLPPSFTYTPARLTEILSQLEPARRNVIEFRHASWWNDAVFAAFRQTRTIFCSCSAPRLPDELVKTADDIYVRFHGTRKWYRHDYSREELAIWASRIRDSGAKTVWAYFNNDYDGHAIQNARELLRQLKKP